MKSALIFVVAVWGAATMQALTVATYNLENYLVANRMVEGVYRENYPKPEAEKLALVSVISAASPDVLAVQEMGSRVFLQDFQRELALAGQSYPHTEWIEADDTERHVAILSKIPFKEVKRHTDLAFDYFGTKRRVRRGVLEAIFATDHGDVSVFVVHLKSKFTERPDDPESAKLRQEEARAVRDLVLARHPDPTRARFVLCGDFNDTRGSRTLQTIQKRGQVKLGELLPAADTRGETWTHFFRREEIYSRVDYFLVSPAILPFVEEGRALIHDGAQSTEGSDHRLVYTKLNLKARP